MPDTSQGALDLVSKPHWEKFLSFSLLLDPQEGNDPVKEKASRSILEASCRTNVMPRKNPGQEKRLKLNMIQARERREPVTAPLQFSEEAIMFIDSRLFDPNRERQGLTSLDNGPPDFQKPETQIARHVQRNEGLLIHIASQLEDRSQHRLDTSSRRQGIVGAMISRGRFLPFHQ
jgi:hypothetical protein